ncbi:hypothetical protein [Streptomyces sp. NPDC002156]
MKIRIRIAGGVVLLLLGALWSLQGSGVIGGSGMSGKGQFLGLGLLMAVAGVVVIVGGVKKMRARTRS